MQMAQAFAVLGSNIPTSVEHADRLLDKAMALAERNPKDDRAKEIARLVGQRYADLANAELCESIAAAGVLH